MSSLKTADEFLQDFVFEPSDGLPETATNESIQSKGDAPTIGAVVSTDAQTTEPKGYKARKPRWWKALSGKATKGQRRSIAAMKDYKLERPAYGDTIDWDAVFHGTSQGDVWLELGFGGGDNLLALAEKHLNTNFVGADISQVGLGKIFTRMHHSVQRKRFWSGYSECTSEAHTTSSNDVAKLQDDRSDESFRQVEVTDPYANLRVYSGDGVKLLPYLPTASVSTILVTFPDPFEGEHQKEYRLIQEHTLKELYRVLKSNGRLFLATDHEGYHSYSHSVIDAMNNKSSDGMFRPVVPCPDRMEWLPVLSRYERKGWDEGRRTNLSCWQMIADTTERSKAIRQIAYALIPVAVSIGACALWMGMRGR